MDTRRLPWMRRLATDYVANHAALAPFFAGHPSDPEAWSRAIAATTAHARPRAEVAALLAAQQERRGAPAESVAAARALAEPGSVAIVTGQQAGLFGGPLFTLLKAITAVSIARDVERQHGVRAVPIFWIDAEDHDWAEVRGAAVFDAELARRVVSADAPEGAGTHAVGTLRWSPAIATTVSELFGTLPPGDFTSWLQDVVGRAYVAGLSPAESFGRLLEQVLGPHGLVVYDSSDPAAKPLVAGLFATELAHAGRTALAAARAGADLVARGYHMQVTPQPGAAALFDLTDGRRPIRKDGDAFIVGDEVRVPEAELVERARTRPGDFSPNVLLRPLVQDTLFPTACYVAGPNELAYLAQLKGVYEALGVPMPLVMPRESATLVDAAALRFLSKHGFAFEALQANDEQALNELLKTLLPESVERSLAEAAASIAARMQDVIAAMPLVDPTLEGRARSALGKMEHELEALSAKVLQAAKRRDETLRRQYLHARAQAFPEGEPQERAIGAVSFLNRYGPPLVTRLLEELRPGGQQHWVIAI